VGCKLKSFCNCLQFPTCQQRRGLHGSCHVGLCHEFTVIFVHAFGSFSSCLLPAIVMPECSIQAIKFHERDKEDPSVCCTEELTHYFFSLTQFQRYVDLRKSNPTDDIKLIGWG
jgi:aerobic-type carbon monoxide dehydrogenase small subunit (CoxS/CutS family)